jgi:hypothetical protein
MHQRLSGPWQRSLGLALTMLLWASAASAVDIEGALLMAADQPQIYMRIQGTYGGPNYTVEGETANIQAYFDTGCSGILLSPETAGLLYTGTKLGLDSAVHDGNTVTFQDVGVGGGYSSNVSYGLYYSLDTYSMWSDPGQLAFAQKYGPARMQLNQVFSDELSEPIDVVGTPAMVGKVVVIDPKPPEQDIWGSDYDVMHASVYNPGNSAIPDTNRHVKLTLSSLDRLTQTSPPEAAAAGEGPTLAHNPFIGPNPVAKIDSNVPAGDVPGITVAYGGHSATGSFLLDTGAQFSIISTEMAEGLHIRYKTGHELGSDDPELEMTDGTPLSVDQFQMPVGGLGGHLTAAGFNLASLSVPTMEGDPLKYLYAPVLVADITATDYLGNGSLTLDGVFGMNFLALSAAPDLSDIHAGAFNWLVYDDPNAILGLDVKGLTTTPEPGAFVLMTIGAAMLFLRRLWRRCR